MADVTIKILSKVETTAVRSIASPLSAAEAKGGVLGENAMWTGTLTADNSLTVLVGQQQLVAGNVYHLTLQEQAGKQKLLGMCCAVEFLPSLHGHLHSMFVHLRPKPGCHHRCEFESSNKSIAGASTQERHSLRLNSSEHAHASSSGHEMASFVQDGLNPESVARQAASGFLIGSIQSLHAVGTSGPVFKAR